MHVNFFYPDPFWDGFMLKPFCASLITRNNGVFLRCGYSRLELYGSPLSTFLKSDFVEHGDLFLHGKA